jgi:hypothetical protein
MKKTLLFFLSCLTAVSAAGHNYLPNGDFEYGLNAGWEYAATAGSDATFLLDDSRDVMEGSVGLKIVVTAVSKQQVDAVSATTRMTARNDSIYLLRFWARGPEEAKVHVEVVGSLTPGVLYEMHKGKTLFYLPFKVAPEKQGDELLIRFGFRDDRSKEKISTSTECSVGVGSGATYYLDGVEVLDSANDRQIDVINTFYWNNNLPTTAKGWVAGDNDISLPLPDGRRIWFFNDSFYATANPRENRLNDWGSFVRNAVVVQETDNTLTTRPVTNQGGQTVFFRIPDDRLIKEGNSVKNFFWIGDAIVEDGKIKVHLIQCVEANGGVSDTNEPYIASFSYPELAYLGLEKQDECAAEYETFFTDDRDNKIYLYRASDLSSIETARTDLGNLSGKNGAWEYWDGNRWTTTRPRPTGHVSRYYDVMKLGPDNYAQVIMHGYTHAVKVAFAQAPQGPWTSPVTVFEASKDEASSYYMPNFHGRLPDGTYAISYSANFTYCLFMCRDCDTWAFVDKYWYRPRYIRVDLMALSPYSVKYDCAGVENGEAYIDPCGQCVDPSTGDEPCITAIAKLYPACHFTGKAIGLDVGNYTATDLSAFGYTANTLSSLELRDGYVAELFDGDKFAGNSTLVDATIACLDAQAFDDKTVSLVIRRRGTTHLTGHVVIRNKQSGLSMSVEDPIENHAMVTQEEYTGQQSQQFELKYVGNGYYHIVNTAAGLPVSIAGTGLDPRDGLELWDGLNYTDITDREGGLISAQYPGAQSTESVDNLTDNNPATKYRTTNKKAWIAFRADKPYVVTCYSLTSPSNAPVSDPKNWSLQASVDGIDWVRLDTVSGFTFAARIEEKRFYIKNETAYTHYRMNLESYSGNALHLAEWKLFTGESPQEGLDRREFILSDAGSGQVKLINKRSDMVLEVLDGLYHTGVGIRQMPDIGQPGALWQFEALAPSSHRPSVVDKSVTGFTIHPNPVHRTLHIALPTGWKGGDLLIYDLNGLLRYTATANRESFDLSHLRSGYYIAKLVGESGLFITRFIKR